MHILKLKNISKAYKKNQALNNVSLEIKQGEVFSIIGPNGAGKTTLIKIISNYLSPDSGQIEFLNNKKPNIGVSYGGAYGFYYEVSVYENLKFYAHLEKVKWRNVKKEVNRVIDLVGLQEHKKKKFLQLSMGMKQRLHIAKSLLNNPELLILDEPTSGVDVDVARLIRKNILDLKKEGVTILITSHIMKDIERLADRIALIDKGQIFHVGDLDSIISLANSISSSPVSNLEDAYLVIYDHRSNNNENS